MVFLAIDEHRLAVLCALPQMLSSLNLKWQGHSPAFLNVSIPEHPLILYGVDPM